MKNGFQTTPVLIVAASVIVAGLPGALRAQDLYAQGIARFEADIASKRPLVKNDANLPFLLSHGRKTAKAILMVHGLSDSPYYMRSLAEIFYDAGYNVVAVLLPGHGTRPEDLLNIRLKQWKQEVALGLEVAGQLGEEVSLAGFSTGGALALNALSDNYAQRRPLAVKGLYLFSPAFEIANDNAALACNLPLFGRFKPWGADDPNAAEDNPYRYNKLALNGACQLYRLTQENALKQAETLSAVADNGVSVFAVQSDHDTVVKTAPVVAFMDQWTNEVRRKFILYPKEAGIKHASVTRPELNPFYRELAEELRAFIGADERAPMPAISSMFRESLPSPALESLRVMAQTGASF